MTANLQSFYHDISSKLIAWYNIHKRDLPWRETKDPYFIWLSEIILQQTRVDQGLSYYNKFSAHYPSIKNLAEASEDEVLKLWQGLGYYSRARNLHKTAQDIVRNYNGIFPNDYKTILSLTGIGDYTAAAIASFAFDIPVATVDGNVYRVLSRLFAIDSPIDTGQGKKTFSSLAQDLLNKKDPATHNQAIMELGALQCTPVNPNCDICPLVAFCQAYNLNTISSLPVKKGKVSVKKRYFNYFDVSYGKYTYIHKRKNNDIWKSLYELPLIETAKEYSIEEILQDKDFAAIFNSELQYRIQLKAELKHVLSHQIIYAKFYHIDINDDRYLEDHYLKIEESDIENYAISRLVHKYIESKTQ